MSLLRYCRSFRFLTPRSRFSSSAAAMGATVNTSERLAKLRELMGKKETDVNAYVVLSEDQHGSEYIAECDERRAFISGFNGSAGCAIITPKDALLFTDGRYFLQAESQLDKNWKLMKQGLPDVPTWQDYLTKHLEESSRIGIDATLINAEDASSLSKNLTPRKSTLVSLPHNLVDQIWTDRPARPQNPVVHLEEKFSGESHESKLGRLRDELNKKQCTAIVLTALDEIAWLYNLRGSDIDFNPVFFAYAVVTMNGATLFVQGGAPADVDVKPYEEFWTFLKEFKSEGKVLVTDKSSLAIAEAVGKDNYTLLPSPVSLLKSIKNATELEGFRQSHIRDGAALVKYFSWLEDQLNQGKKLSEWGAASKLEEYRAEQGLFKGLSFPTISSTGVNAAIIHYSPDSKDSAIIDKEEVYLCDSGAQFFDGTTDVTRTWHFGAPKPEEIRANTRVLQGHIAIDTAVFPNGTTGYTIDSWARRALWKDGLDYRHGTGHGVGHFLNVHEGPHGIGTRISLNANPLKPGMTVSNEPGYYADGKFGIRIENIVLVKEVQTPNNFGNKGYLGFEHVTMCPMHKKLVDTTLLTIEETKWLNDYHEEVWQKVSPLLQDDKSALDWLKRECSPI